MLHALAWLFACVWLLSPLQALAQIAPDDGYRNSYYGANRTYTTADLACQDVGPSNSSATNYAGAGTSSGFCHKANGNTFGTTWSRVIGVICPANSTLAAGQCLCNAGFVQDGSSCVVDAAAAYCTEQNGTQAVGVSSPKPTGTVGLASYSLCYSNQYSLSACSGTMEPDICGEGPDGKWHCTGKVTFSDSVPCTGTLTPENPEGVPEPLPEPPPPGMCPGEVNGVAVNVPCKSTTSATTSSKSTTEGGTTTEETKTRETTCTGAGSCTTTTTTNTTVGGVITTKTETMTEPRGEFCASNPGASECGQQSTFGGSCQSNFTCTGDPVQCATARAVNDHLCRFKDLMDMPSDVQALAQSVLDGSHVENPRDSAMQIDVGVFDQSDPLSSACPGDIPVSLSGFSFVIPLSQACDWLQIIGNILVICSLFGATVFVLRGGN